ncbi:hypothetical protein AB0M46_21435 [Dactylosporangium sp. NPDC051485]|uniref:hypothetical protein n=1 Tax=Dactylosporangium sp. NPDC051485 TaxID=3154846 RepID=UPI00342DEB15
MTTTPSSKHTATPTPSPAGTGDEPWTGDRIRALGVVTDLPTAARVFGLGRALAYQLARDGQFPVQVLRVGNRYRVPVAAILAALHLPAAPAGSSPSATNTEPSTPPAVPSAAPGEPDPVGDLPASAQSSVDHHGEMRSTGPQHTRAAPTEGAP